MTTNELTFVLNAVLQNQSKADFGVNEVIAILSALIALGALVVAWWARNDAAASAREAQIANELNRSIATRQGIIELHMVWLNIASIDPSNPVPVDVISAAKALDTTSSLWLSKVLDRNIILNSYWSDFKESYESISQCDQIIPEDGRKYSDLLTKEITQAYDEMQFITKARQT
jgi:hypothetical protein